MARLEARVKKLEQGDAAGVCQCTPRRLCVVWPDDGPTGPDTCPDCGRPVLRLVVKYEDPKGVDDAEPTGQA